jgi:hypothetical protein
VKNTLPKVKPLVIVHFHLLTKAAITENKNEVNCSMGKWELHFRGFRKDNNQNLEYGFNYQIGRLGDDV